MSTTRDYEFFKSKTLQELAKLRFPLDSPTALPQLAYEEKLMEQKHELDLKLLREQTRMMKSSNLLIAIATISAALLGAIVGAVLQYKLMQKPETTIQKTEQPSTVPTPKKVSASPSPLHDGERYNQRVAPALNPGR